MSQVVLYNKTTTQAGVVNVQSNLRQLATFIRQVKEGGIIVQLPFAPLDVDYDNIGLQYVEIDRPSKKPILDKRGIKLRKISLTFLLADRTSHGCAPVEKTLDQLRQLSLQDEDVMLVYGLSVYPFSYRVTDLSYTSLRRNVNGVITQAEIDIGLTESSTLTNPIIEGMKTIAYEPATPVANPNVPATSTTGGGGSSLVTYPPADDDTYRRPEDLEALAVQNGIPAIGYTHVAIVPESKPIKTPGGILRSL